MKRTQMLEWLLYNVKPAAELCGYSIKYLDGCVEKNYKDTQTIYQHFHKNMDDVVEVTRAFRIQTPEMWAHMKAHPIMHQSQEWLRFKRAKKRFAEIWNSKPRLKSATPNRHSNRKG